MRFRITIANCRAALRGQEASILRCHPWLALFGKLAGGCQLHSEELLCLPLSAFRG